MINSRYKPCLFNFVVVWTIAAIHGYYGYSAQDHVKDYSQRVKINLISNQRILENHERMTALQILES